MCVCVCVRACEYAYSSVCQGERGGERECVCVCVCVSARTCVNRLQVGTVLLPRPTTWHTVFGR